MNQWKQYHITGIHNIQRLQSKVIPPKECSSGKIPLEVSKYPCLGIRLNTSKINLQ